MYPRQKLKRLWPEAENPPKTYAKQIICYIPGAGLIISVTSLLCFYWSIGEFVALILTNPLSFIDVQF